MTSDIELLNEAARLLENHKRLAFCTVVEKKGSGPRDVGAKMIVCEDGKTYGTIGGGNFERALIDKCLQAINEGKSRKVTFNLTKADKEGTVGTGMICGGELTVLADVLEPAARMVIVGLGHVASPLAKLASTAGFRVVVVDDELGLANKERFPMADEILAGDFAKVLGALELNSSDYVIVTHGEPEHDYVALKTVLKNSSAYVALLGSRTKFAVLSQRLRVEGVGEAKLNAIHAPAGLDIGAQTPEEIGVAILAQVIQFRRKIL